MRYFMQLAYDGGPYSGWQTQPGVVTVQQTLEAALTTLLKQPTAVTGAGRTDAGVHARMMIAHFDAPETDAKRLKNLARSLTAICRPSIVVEAVWPVPDDAHARFDATARTYRYFVATEPSPFRTRYCWTSTKDLDFGAMNDAAKELIGTRDFTSFSKLHTDVKTNICTVTAAEWKATDDGRHYFEITANRFLRNMVRAAVGTLVDVGRGKISTQDVVRILEQKDRCAAGTSMPGDALFLWNVDYPEHLKNKN